MNFGQIVTAVCTDGIDPGRRSDAQEWVRNRHARLWGAEPWTFKQKVAAITFSSGQQVVQAADAPTDIQNVYALYDSDGWPIRGIADIRTFFDMYNTLSGASQVGRPEAYTVINEQVFIGPLGDGSSGLVVYEKQKPSLVNDPDLTGLPDGFDSALVAGAKALGFKLTNVPLAEELEQEYQNQLADLVDDWTDSVLETGGQVGAYRPGLGRARWWR